MAERRSYRGVLNPSLKPSPDVFGATQRFSMNALCLQVPRRGGSSVALEFGASRLWLDRVASLSQRLCDVWIPSPAQIGHLIAPSGQ